MSGKMKREPTRKDYLAKRRTFYEGWVRAGRPSYAEYGRMTGISGNRVSQKIKKEERVIALEGKAT